MLIIVASSELMNHQFAKKKLDNSLNCICGDHFSTVQQGFNWLSNNVPL